MDKKPLTPTQRRVLLLLREHGPTAFFGETREFQFWQSEAGPTIQAYMEPERSLAIRGLLQRVPSNRPGHVYGLTEDGAARAARLKVAPPRQRRWTVR